MYAIDIGIVYTPALEPLLVGGGGADVVVVEPETLWRYHRERVQPYEFPVEARRALSRLPQPKLVHSVGAGVGGTRIPDAVFRAALAEVVRELDPAWVSGHLAVIQAGAEGRNPFHAGFLLPPRQTGAGATVAARSVTEVARGLERPFAVENGVSYLQPRADELADGEFLAQVVEWADCALLLDLHNAWCNERNGRQPVREFLDALPLDRVIEIHVAGGFEFEGFWLDAHSGEVPDPVLNLLEELIPSLPSLRAVTLEVFPSFMDRFGIDAVSGELDKLRRLRDRVAPPRRDPAIQLRDPPLVVMPSREATSDVAAWEAELGELVTFGAVPRGFGLRDDPGIDLYRRLIWRFRAGSIAQTLDVLTRYCLAQGADVLERWLDAYLRTVKPEPFASEDAFGFLRFLREGDLDGPCLGDVITFEAARLRAVLSGNEQLPLFEFDPRSWLEDIVAGRVPAELNRGSYELPITRDGDVAVSAP